MRTIRRSAALLVRAACGSAFTLIVAAANCSPSVPAMPLRQECKVLPNLFYGKAHRPRCTGDLYVPQCNTRAPLVVLIHGGGWQAGDKSGAFMQDLCSRLVDSGYAVFNINYRLVQD